MTAEKKRAAAEAPKREPGKVKAGGGGAAGMALEHPR